MSLRSDARRIEQIYLTLYWQLRDIRKSPFSEERHCPLGPQAGSETGSALCERLRHAVKEAEAVVHRAKRIDVVRQTIRHGLAARSGEITRQASMIGYINAFILNTAVRFATIAFLALIRVRPRD